MSKHEMVIDNGHVVLVEKGRRFIIDTGSPSTFSRVNEVLCLGGEEKQLSSSSAQMIQTINAEHLLKHEVDGLLGIDVLNGMSWEFDFAAPCILVNEAVTRKYENSLCLNISILSGISFDMSVGWQTCKAILDTGAFVSYASSKLVAGIASCGNVDDSNPILGEIHTTLHQLTIRLGKRDFPLKAGKMPMMLEAMMGMIGVDCVLGITGLNLTACRLDLIENRLEF